MIYIFDIDLGFLFANSYRTSVSNNPVFNVENNPHALLWGLFYRCAVG